MICGFLLKESLYAVPTLVVSVVFPPFCYCSAVVPQTLKNAVNPALKTLQFTIIHTNDNHGKFWRNRNGEMGMAARKTLIDRIRAEVEAEGGKSLVLSAGDINTGVPESDIQEAEPDFIGMNLIGYDAMTVGNHEFDNSLPVLLKQEKWADFPFLSANIFYKDTGKPVFKTLDYERSGRCESGSHGVNDRRH